MTDENIDTTSSLPPQQSAQNAEQPTVAFCQQCGRGLTVNTVRAVGSSIFCESCATRYSVPPGGQSGAIPGGYTSVHSPAVDAGAASSPEPGQPNPVLAGLLGLIPGVGAMYNGQYAKGVIHLVIFVVLTSLADNLNWVMWWFVWGWIFYQAFEAYHTAQAKRDGRPLPDPFGWNDLGDRLGFSRTSPPVSSPGRNSTASAPSPYKTSQTYKAGPTAAPFTAPSAPPPVHETSTSTQAAGIDSVLPPASWTTPVPDAAYTPIPSGTPTPPPYAPFTTQYGPTYTGVPVSPGIPPLATPSLSQRFPAGAAWLIGLGTLFLTANLAPGWRLEARWLVPVLLALVAFWIGGRRVETALRNRNSGTPAEAGPLAENLVGAAVLLTLAILLALQNAYLVPLRHSWPAVLIVWGALLLAGRARPVGEIASGNPSGQSGQSETPEK